MVPRCSGEYRADTSVPSIAAMSDLTGDEWAAVLVGHQWPGSSALTTLSAAAASRREVGSAFHGYADVLCSVADSVLSDQRGDAAESIRESFRAGADHARRVGERNAAKADALARAQRCAAQLRSALAEIADRRARQIHSIIDGDDPAPAKTARIAEVVQEAQTEADSRSALCMQEIYGSIQAVLDACGTDIPARRYTGG